MPKDYKGTMTVYALATVAKDEQTFWRGIRSAELPLDFGANRHGSAEPEGHGYAEGEGHAEGEGYAEGMRGLFTSKVNRLLYPNT